MLFDFVNIRYGNYLFIDVWRYPTLSIVFSVGSAVAFISDLFQRVHLWNKTLECLTRFTDFDLLGHMQYNPGLPIPR